MTLCISIVSTKRHQLILTNLKIIFKKGKGEGPFTCTDNMNLTTVCTTSVCPYIAKSGGNSIHVVI